MLGAIAPLSNTSHNYSYSRGYMLSIVLHTISMVLYVVSLHVRICCMKVLVTATFRMRSTLGGQEPTTSGRRQSVGERETVTSRRQGSLIKTIALNTAEAVLLPQHT